MPSLERTFRRSCNRSCGLAIAFKRTHPSAVPSSCMVSEQSIHHSTLLRRCWYDTIILLLNTPAFIVSNKNILRYWYNTCTMDVLYPYDTLLYPCDTPVSSRNMHKKTASLTCPVSVIMFSWRIIDYEGAAADRARLVAHCALVLRSGIR